MLNGPAFTDRTGHGQTTFPKFPRFAMAGPQPPRGLLKSVTAVGCAAVTISDNQTICVQFLDGYAAQRGVNAPHPLNYFIYIYFFYPILSVLYHAYVFAQAKISALFVCQFFLFFFRTAFYFRTIHIIYPVPVWSIVISNHEYANINLKKLIAFHEYVLSIR